MPVDPDITIDLTDANKGQTDVKNGDKIAWKNSSGSDITLNPPSCVSPGTATEIPNGTTSRNFSVNGNVNGSYDYTFDVGAEVGVRTGNIKIDPQ
jgi:hypothetical protein